MQIWHSSGDYKNCLICQRIFYRKYTIGSIYWNKVKYCSYKCLGLSKITHIKLNCDFCWNQIVKMKSHYDKAKRHFCNSICQKSYFKYMILREDTPNFGKGYSKEEKQKRIKARSILCNAVRDEKIKRLSCAVCGKNNAEAHHDNYDNPLQVRWLCRKHHQQLHKSIRSL